MVGELLTWRRLLTRRTLLAPPAAHLILGGGRDSSSAVSRRSIPELRMEIQVGIFAPATACRQPGGFARGTLSPSRPRDSLVCVGVAPDVISAAAVLTLYELNREVHIACIGTVASQSESA
jgi:hypothetical protein